MASTASDTTQFQLNNLGTNVSIEDIHQFLGFANTDEEKKLCSVALSVKAGQNFAFVMVPQDMGARVEDKKGTELHGRVVDIVKMSNAMSCSQPAAVNTSQNMDSEGEPSISNQQSTSRSGYAQVAAPKQDIVLTYVELDATAVLDCYSLPKSAEISLAVRRTLADSEEEWKIFSPNRNNPGVWKLEMENIDAFKGVSELKVTNDSPAIAKVSIKSERVILKDGKLRRQTIQNPNDLLITLRLEKLTRSCSNS